MQSEGLKLQRHVEIDDLLELSHRIGNDPLLVQAGTGNTSVKLKGILWIKASGKWLRDALHGLILVPIDLEDARRSLRHGGEIQVLYPSSAPAALKPSIETAMHACLPQRVVVHVHSVNAIAWAVRQDAPEQLRQKLSGLAWAWIPYVASGVPLARAVERCLRACSDTGVFVLGNHGLVIAADSCADAETLLFEVEERLALQARPAPHRHSICASMVGANPAWRLPEWVGVHALALDPVSVGILAGGILSPCQATFLGSEIPPVCPSGSCLDALDEEPVFIAIPPSFVIVESSGVLVRRNATRAENEVLAGLVNVVQRIDPSAPVRYLTAPEVRNVLNHETARYRESVERNGAVIDPH